MRTFKKISTILLSSLLFSSISYADLDSNLNNYFTGLGYGANTTKPSIYQGQEMGYLNAGSMTVKAHADNLQLAGIELPSLKAGCGSIDLFMGGFSFVNSQKLVQFGQEVLQDAIPVAIDLALQTISPQLAEIKDKLQTWADKINNLNMNSCQAAQDLVSGKWAKDLAGESKACKDEGMSSNKFQDWSDAIYGCSTGGKSDEETDAASKDPKYKHLILKNINVVWSDVLEKSAFLSQDKELEQVYMTISGTIIFDKDGHANTFLSRLSDKNLRDGILYGGKVPMYSCDDYDKCLTIKPDATTTISKDHSLVAQVSKEIQNIATAYKTDQPLTPEEKSFLGLADSPILTMIQNEIIAGMDTSGVDQYSEVIAQQLLTIYLQNIISNIKTAFASAQIDDASRSTLEKSIEGAENTVRSMSLRSYQRLSASNMELQRIIAVKKMGAGEISSKTKDNMNFGDQ